MSYSETAEDLKKLRDAKTEYELLSSQTRQQPEMPQPSKLISCLNDTLTQVTALKSCSFRVGWGPGWTMINPGQCLGNFQMQSTNGDSDDSGSPTSSYLFRGTSSRVDAVRATREISDRYYIFVFY